MGEFLEAALQLLVVIIVVVACVLGVGVAAVPDEFKAEGAGHEQQGNLDVHLVGLYTLVCVFTRAHVAGRVYDWFQVFKFRHS